jgi:hypothetical protein
MFICLNLWRHSANFLAILLAVLNLFYEYLWRGRGLCIGAIARPQCAVLTLPRVVANSSFVFDRRGRKKAARFLLDKLGSKMQTKTRPSRIELERRGREIPEVCTTDFCYFWVVFICFCEKFLCCLTRWNLAHVLGFWRKQLGRPCQNSSPVPDFQSVIMASCVFNTISLSFPTDLCV